MADYRVLCSWPLHHKRVKLQRRLGAEGVLALMDLWGFAAESKPTGVFSGMTTEDLAIAAGYQGDADKWVGVLVEVGLLVKQRGTYAIHDWAANNPFAAGKPARSAAAKAAASVKWGSPAPDDGPSATRSRRLSEARARGRHTDEEWSLLVKLCGGVCVRCRTEGQVVKDHVVPVYKQGSDAIGNLQPLCKRCNSQKGPETTDFVPSDVRERLERLLRTPAEMAAVMSAAGVALPAPTPLPSPSVSEDLCVHGPQSIDQAVMADRIRRALEHYHAGERVRSETASALRALGLSDVPGSRARTVTPTHADLQGCNLLDAVAGFNDEQLRHSLACSAARSLRDRTMVWFDGAKNWSRKIVSQNQGTTPEAIAKGDDGKVVTIGRTRGGLSATDLLNLADAAGGES